MWRWCRWDHLISSHLIFSCRKVITTANSVYAEKNKPAWHRARQVSHVICSKAVVWHWVGGWDFKYKEEIVFRPIIPSCHSNCNGVNRSQKQHQNSMLKWIYNIWEGSIICTIRSAGKSELYGKGSPFQRQFDHQDE